MMAVGEDDTDRLTREIDAAEARRETGHPEPEEAPVNLAAGGYGGGPRTDEAAREEAEREW